MRNLDHFNASDQLDKCAAKATRSDMGRVLGQKDAILSKANKGALAKCFQAIRDLLQFVAAYANGSYRVVPWSTVAAAVGALIYVLSPIDFIPDFIPGVGLIDDAAVLAAAMRMIGDDLAAFVVWRDRQG